MHHFSGIRRNDGIREVCPRIFLKSQKNLPRGNNHGGKRSKAQARLRKQIIAKTTTEKPPHATHWSARLLAEALGTSHNFVAKVWREYGFKPHLISQFKISNDPLFAEKLEDEIMKRYLSIALSRKCQR
ncbi:MAG: hypothetical protein KZQ97_11315 [Candidatus Thiodiazotropha sp. (ex Dulcina madagascariensis)]|nr:hypothetical protein [Candidatus Thiodiazotropha sp. (ex Dulcina madagascariensis)]